MTVTRNVSLPEEVDARLKTLTREEMPNFSKLVSRLLTRELDRLDTARARKAEKRTT
jgi:hypothetical protein